MAQRPIRYADIIRAESPNARARYFAGRDIDTQRQQFDQGIDLQKQQMDEQRRAANRSNIINSAGVGYMVGGPIGAGLAGGGSYLMTRGGKDIRNLDKKLMGSSMFSMNKMNNALDKGITGFGKYIKNPIKGTTSTIKDLGSKVSSVIKNPIKAVSKVSYLCTAVHDNIGLDPEDRKALSKMYQFALDKHPIIGEFYKEFGPILVKEIEACSGADETWEEINNEIIQPTVEMLKSGDVEGGMYHYQEKTWDLFREYTDFKPPEED